MRDLLVAILLIAIPAQATDRTYETGKLSNVTITDSTASVTIPPMAPNASALVLPLRLGVIFHFTIEQKEITFQAGCFSKDKKSYAAEWVVNDPVQFRVEKDKLFLKRPNGKELRLALLMRVRDAKSETQTSAEQMIPQCR
jgi:hypothetical protein